MYMNLQQQTEKVTKNGIFQSQFFENPARMATMHSDHSQQLKTSRLQEKFRLAAFMIRNIHTKTFKY